MDLCSSCPTIRFQLKYVFLVLLGGAAHRTGVQVGDKIIKVGIIVSVLSYFPPDFFFWHNVWQRCYKRITSLQAIWCSSPCIP